MSATITEAEQQLIDSTARLATPALILAHRGAYELASTPGLTAEDYRAAELIECITASELERRGMPVLPEGH